MMKKCVYPIIWLLVFQGCASILSLNHSSLVLDSKRSGMEFCFDESKIKLTNIIYGREKTDYETQDSSRKEEFKLINNEIEKLFIFKNCKNYLKIQVEIINKPVENKSVLDFLNIISIGIIPYWAEYENIAKITITNKENKETDSFSSTYKYERVQSIFLIPVSPFYIGGNIELNLKTIPLHFQNISNELNKKEGPKY